MRYSFIGSWEEYADDHVLLIRTISQDYTELEFAIAKWRESDAIACFHGTIYISDYLDYAAGLKKLDLIAIEQGYRDFDDLVLEGLDDKNYDAAHGVVLNDDGSVNKQESPAYVINLEFVAALIVEHMWNCMDEDALVYMTEEEAIRWVKDLTGMEYQGI